MIRPRSGSLFIDPAFAAFPLKVRQSNIHGFGVFATEDIPPRRKVIEYTGERVSAGEVAARLAARLRGSGPPRVDIFHVNRSWSIDPSAGGSGAELVNHSCDPNLFARTIRGHVYYFSLRRINAGEELLVDYLLPPDTYRLRCRCGSPNCRGFMNRNER